MVEQNSTVFLGLQVIYKISLGYTSSLIRTKWRQTICCQWQHAQKCYKKKKKTQTTSTVSSPGQEMTQAFENSSNYHRFTLLPNKIQDRTTMLITGHQMASFLRTSQIIYSFLLWTLNRYNMQDSPLIFVSVAICTQMASQHDSLCITLQVIFFHQHHLVLKP